MLTHAQNALYWREWAAAKRALRVDRNYVQGVVDQVNFEHRGSAKLHPSLDDLTVDDLKKVIVALRKQARRKAREKTDAAHATPALLTKAPSAMGKTSGATYQSTARAVEVPF